MRVIQLFAHIYSIYSLDANTHTLTRIYGRIQFALHKQFRLIFVLTCDWVVHTRVAYMLSNAIVFRRQYVPSGSASVEMGRMIDLNDPVVLFTGLDTSKSKSRISIVEKFGIIIFLFVLIQKRRHLNLNLSVSPCCGLQTTSDAIKFVQKQQISSSFSCRSTVYEYLARHLIMRPESRMIVVITTQQSTYTYPLTHVQFEKSRNTYTHATVIAT